jgi:Na+-transporting methylmalonyl-CoA/oxaloacetate decarboxylase gamma subunit
VTTYWLLAQTAGDTPARGWEAIVKENGIGISITGMLIVFAALIIISVFIALVPKLLDVLDPILPKGHTHVAPPSPEEQTPLDHEKVVAAIGLVLHTELQKITGK